jgi:hypothetical protein
MNVADTCAETKKAYWIEDIRTRSFYPMVAVHRMVVSGFPEFKVAETVPPTIL